MSSGVVGYQGHIQPTSRSLRVIWRGHLAGAPLMIPSGSYTGQPVAATEDVLDFICTYASHLRPSHIHTNTWLCLMKVSVVIRAQGAAISSTCSADTFGPLALPRARVTPHIPSSHTPDPVRESRHTQFSPHDLHRSRPVPEVIIPFYGARASSTRRAAPTTRWPRPQRQTTWPSRQPTATPRTTGSWRSSSRRRRRRRGLRPSPCRRMSSSRR